MQIWEHGASAWMINCLKERENRTNKRGQTITRKILNDYFTKCYPPVFVPMPAFVETFASLPPSLKQNAFRWEETNRHVSLKPIHKHTIIWNFIPTEGRERD